MKIKLITFLLLCVVGIGTAQILEKSPEKSLKNFKRSDILCYRFNQRQRKSYLGGANTDDNGEFTIKSLALKSYTVEIQYIGFRKYIGSAILSENKKEATFKVSLEEEATQLKGVNIVSERSTIEQKIDRKVITVGKDLTAGTSASDIMNNIPSVNVNLQDGKLSLRGNEKCACLN